MLVILNMLVIKFFYFIKKNILVTIKNTLSFIKVP